MHIIRCLIFPGNPAAALQWTLRLEDADERIRCITPVNAADAAAVLQDCGAGVIIMPDTPQGRLFLSALTARTCPQPPYVILDRWHGMPCDAVSSPSEAHTLAKTLLAWQSTGRLPILASLQLPALTCLARALLHSLDTPNTLHAMRFLPDMLALCAVHPPLLQDVSHRLYPLVARRHGLTASAVERSLRLLIESTWSKAGAPALERFFGHSVDPERGKPTNKEFLARMQERIALAYRRLR